MKQVGAGNACPICPVHCVTWPVAVSRSINGVWVFHGCVSQDWSGAAQLPCHGLFCGVGCWAAGVVLDSAAVGAFAGGRASGAAQGDGEAAGADEAVGAGEAVDGAGCVLDGTTGL